MLHPRPALHLYQEENKGNRQAGEPQPWVEPWHKWQGIKEPLKDLDGDMSDIFGRFSPDL